MSVQLAHNFCYLVRSVNFILKGKGFEAKAAIPYLSILYIPFQKKSHKFGAFLVEKFFFGDSTIFLFRFFYFLFPFSSDGI